MSDKMKEELISERLKNVEDFVGVLGNHVLELAGAVKDLAIGGKAQAKSIEMLEQRISKIEETQKLLLLASKESNKNWVQSLGDLI